MRTIENSTGLSFEALYILTEDKCSRCGVNFEFCLKHVLESKPTDRDEFERDMDEFLASAYFTNYFELYEGIIEYRKCASSIEEARQIYNEREARKPENIN